MLIVDVPPAPHPGPALATAASALARAPIGSLPEPELRELLRAVRCLQADLDRALVRIGSRADELARSGASAPAAELLLDRGQVSGRRARSERARVDIVARVPDLAAALAAGKLTGDQLDSLARRCDRLPDDDLARLDVSGLADAAPGLPVDTFDGVVKRAIEAVTADGGAADARQTRDAAEVRHWLDRRTGLGHLHAVLDAERYEAVVGAVEAHTATLANQASEPTTRDARLAATALIDLVTGSAGARRAGRPEVIVVVDADALHHGFGPRTVAQTSRGADLSEPAIARLCCDAVLRRVRLDQRGVPIDVGRAHRTATNAQWAALRAIHSTCAWSDCGRPIDHCQIHHIREWEHGGPSDLANLVPLCSEHHHRVHEGGWSIRLEPDRRLVITRPDGHHHAITQRPTRRPPPPPRPPPRRTTNGQRPWSTWLAGRILGAGGERATAWAGSARDTS